MAQVLICPHCGNACPQEIIQTVVKKNADEIQEYGPIDYYYHFVKCSSCGDVCVYMGLDLWNSPDDLYEARRLYPEEKIQEAYIPEQIKNEYIAAQRVRKIDAKLYLVAARKTLEAMCNEQNASGRDLKDQISNLASKGIIPANLSQIATAMRVYGNIGAHSDPKEVSEIEASILEEFLHLMIQYIYVGPKKLLQLRELYIKNQ